MGAQGGRGGDEADAPPVIGSLSPGDLDELGALFEAHTGRPAELDTFGSWIETSPSAAARDGDTLVGYAVGKPFAPDITELASILVAPMARDQGIGSRLIAHLEAGCVARGHRAVVTVTSYGYDVVGEKRSSRPFYERLGYRAILETASTSVLGRTFGDDG